jgi:hypothetical protein
MGSESEVETRNLPVAVYSLQIPSFRSGTLAYVTVPSRSPRDRGQAVRELDDRKGTVKEKYQDRNTMSRMRNDLWAIRRDH